MVQIKLKHFQFTIVNLSHLLFIHNCPHTDRVSRAYPSGILHSQKERYSNREMGIEILCLLHMFLIQSF